jgi:uncharacterized protein (TIGR02145 family)
MKYLLKTIGLILFILSIDLFNSCKKADENTVNLTNGKTTAVFNSNKTYGTMTDQDGNVYKTISLGTQTWMSENLRTTKYRNGEAILEGTANSAWSIIGTSSYCNYSNTKNNDTIATFGRLYNWSAVSDSRNIAPSGWHVPTDAEWSTLITFLGDVSVAGGKLKELNLIHWATPNLGADNSTGFTALPSGERDNDGTFTGLGYLATWWSSSEYNGYGMYRYVYYNGPGEGVNFTFKGMGMAVRCVKDL